jgi:hypothetical protein
MLSADAAVGFSQESCRLDYACQRERWSDRLLRRARKLAQVIVPEAERREPIVRTGRTSSRGYSEVHSGIVSEV